MAARRLAIGRDYLWDLYPATLKRRACQIADCALTQDERRTFVGSAYRPVCG
jgi:hypothetical protein